MFEQIFWTDFLKQYVGWKHIIVTLFWAFLGLVLQYIKYNYSKIMVHLILGFNSGFCALQLLFLQN
jgi:hypothetical protein